MVAIDKLTSTLEEVSAGNFVYKSPSPEKRAMLEKKRWWQIDRLILHPELYAGLRLKFLREDLPAMMASHMQSVYVGYPERLTRQRCLLTIDTLGADDAEWWHSPQLGQKFFDACLNLFPVDPNSKGDSFLVRKGKQELGRLSIFEIRALCSGGDLCFEDEFFDPGSSEWLSFREFEQTHGGFYGKWCR
jgi:hypothetical protein